MPKIESLYGQVFILPPYIFPRILLFESCFQYNSIIFELEYREKGGNDGKKGVT